MKLKRTVKSVPGPAILLVLLACFSLSCWSMTAVQDDSGQSQNGRVYVLTNQAPVNTVVVLHRTADGMLTRLQEVATGGSGSGPGARPAQFSGAGDLHPLDPRTRSPLRTMAGSCSRSIPEAMTFPFWP